MSSRPFNNRCRTNGSTSKAIEGLSAPRIVCCSRSISRSVSLISPRSSSAGSAIVSNPICAALFAKMSPNDGAMTASKP